MEADNMTEKELLEWLGKEDSSAYGECHGEQLDALIAKGWAEVGPTPSGRSRMYARVWLTEAGLAALETNAG
ncbi:hypothetical protein DY251_19200 [Mesorhizobium denitrificans]|uniref:ArsR family transcriptional regulator n=2 Tax=Mesorhizobium denitrificans TaxID=2294114 RepID=A0A371X5T7_9HYPH|nr:hypothetical protein DY251_19200 [Mesorhizobium denitrificans]